MLLWKDKHRELLHLGLILAMRGRRESGKEGRREGVKEREREMSLCHGLEMLRNTWQPHDNTGYHLCSHSHPDAPKNSHKQTHEYYSPLHVNYQNIIKSLNPSSGKYSLRYIRPLVHFYMYKRILVLSIHSVSVYKRNRSTVICLDYIITAQVNLIILQKLLLTRVFVRCTHTGLSYLIC